MIAPRIMLMVPLMKVIIPPFSPQAWREEERERARRDKTGRKPIAYLTFEEWEQFQRIEQDESDPRTVSPPLTPLILPPTLLHSISPPRLPSDPHVRSANFSRSVAGHTEERRRGVC